MKIMTSRLFVAVLLGLSLGLVGCGSSSKKSSKTSSFNSGSSNGDSALEINGDSDSGKAGGLQTVYFDFNCSAITLATAPVAIE